jgi:hypothetical protein
MESLKKEKLIKRIKRISNENSDLKDLLKDIKIEIAQIIANLEDKQCEQQLINEYLQEEECDKSP